MKQISRKAYAEMFGPTTGDRVRLADTDLWIEVEADRTIYGEEVKFGGGKVIRDGMGQSQRGCNESVDVVITNHGHPSGEVLARYRAEHKEPLALGALPPECEVVTGAFWHSEIARHHRHRLSYAVWAVLSRHLLT